jgi:hypothetical protein
MTINHKVAYRVAKAKITHGANKTTMMMTPIIGLKR